MGSFAGAAGPGARVRSHPYAIDVPFARDHLAPAQHPNAGPADAGDWTGAGQTGIGVVDLTSNTC